MKKRSLTILAIAAMLTVGSATISTWAAEGWHQGQSGWEYFDSNGGRLTDTWKKGSSDNQWRYLDSSGHMAINSWVDNMYYVDANGILIADKWLKLQNPNGDYSNQDDYKWYYFGTSGTVITDTWKKIDNKWYYFDGDGAMQTGWILDNLYYCGTDGVMRTGWQKLVPASDDYDDDRNSPVMDDDDGKKWYYFGTSGKKYIPDGDSSARKIDGINYCFDSDGAMLTGWQRVETGSEVEFEIQNYKYFGTDGKVKTGWLSLEPPEDIRGYDGNVEWFYFSTNGTPKVGHPKDEYSTYDLVKINNLNYLFNDRGNPVYGLQKLYVGNSKELYATYYFGDKATSSVVKGRHKIEEGDGTTTEYYFSDSGRGYTGVKDSYLYYMGKLQKAEEGMKYSIVSMPSGNDNVTNYVVNTYGKVAKSTTVKNADGVKYKTSSSGTLLKVDDADPSGSYAKPSEPVWSE